MTEDREATFLRGWTITGAMLLAPGVIAGLWFMASELLGDPSDAAFVGIFWWVYLLMTYFMVEPPALPGAWGVVASLVQWAVVAAVVGVTTRRLTWHRTVLLAGAAIVTAATLAHVAMRLLGHRVAFEGP